MNRSKLHSFAAQKAYWRRLLCSGAIGRMPPPFPSHCYLIAFFDKDSTLKEMGLFSDRSPTLPFTIVHIVVEKWTASTYGAAHSRAKKAIRKGGALGWVRSWIFRTYDERPAPPTELVEKAKEQWKQRAAIMTKWDEEMA